MAYLSSAKGIRKICIKGGKVALSSFVNLWLTSDSLAKSSDGPSTPHDATLSEINAPTVDHMTSPRAEWHRWHSGGPPSKAQPCSSVRGFVYPCQYCARDVSMHCVIRIIFCSCLEAEEHGDSSVVDGAPLRTRSPLNAYPHTP
jgi:hypothetical protein